MRWRYSYRLYPEPGQQVALARAFGCARVVFNDALAAREVACQAGGALLYRFAVTGSADRGQGHPWAGVAD